MANAQVTVMTDVRAAGLPAGVPAGADELTGDSAPGRPGWLPDFLLWHLPGRE